MVERTPSMIPCGAGFSAVEGRSSDWLEFRISRGSCLTEWAKPLASWDNSITPLGAWCMETHLATAKPTMGFSRPKLNGTIGVRHVDRPMPQ
jgi:hypothetical protein